MLRRLARGGSSPSPPPRSDFADFTPPRASPGGKSRLERWGLSTSLLNRRAVVTRLIQAMAILMTALAVFELYRRFEKLDIDCRWRPLGGVLSGLFGDPLGHQGALRSACLAKAGISLSTFLGTNAVIGLLVGLVGISAFVAVLFGATG